MAKGTTRSRLQTPNKTVAYFDRFISGNTKGPVEVEVELFDTRVKDLTAHNLNNLVDFEAVDFYWPLISLCIIFLAQILVVMPISLFVVIGLQLVLTWDLFKRIRRRPSGKRAAGLEMPSGSPGWGWSLALYLASLPGLLGAAFLNQYIARLVTPSHQFAALAGPMAANMTSYEKFEAALFIYMFVSAVIFAPLTEELWFRGIGLAGFMRSTGSPLWSVLWTSVIFGVLHGSGRVLFTTIFGLILGLIRFRTGSLYCCIAIHLLHNFLVMAYSFWAHYY